MNAILSSHNHKYYKFNSKVIKNNNTGNPSTAKFNPENSQISPTGQLQTENDNNLNNKILKRSIGSFSLRFTKYANVLNNNLTNRIYLFLKKLSDTMQQFKNQSKRLACKSLEPCFSHNIKIACINLRQLVKSLIDYLYEMLLSFKFDLNLPKNEETSRVKTNKKTNNNSKSNTIHKKTMVLDLDETLVHCSQIGTKNPDYMIEVFIDKHAKLYYVYKRPHVDEFLKIVSKWYNIVIFTSAHEEYATTIINKLDQENKIFKKKLYRESCSKITRKKTYYSKDLSLVESDLKKVFLIDNNPCSFEINKSNAIPISTWTNNNSTDEALLNMLPFLEALRHVKDVRSVLSLRNLY